MLFVFGYVGLHEPCTTLSLWLGWMQHFLQDMNSAPDHSVIKNKARGRIAILKTASHQQHEENLLILRAICGRGRECLCLSLWDHINPVIFWCCGLVGYIAYFSHQE